MSWQDDLENELDWRFEELAVLKLQAARAPANSLLQRAVLRAIIAMLYAHYEGFCKTAIRIYLREVKARGVRRKECLDRLACFSLQKPFRESKSYSTEQCWEFYMNSLHSALGDVVDYELDSKGEIALEGESNLYPGLLRTNLQNVCLPHTEVDTHDQVLRSLVGRRNDIAHGKKLIVADLTTFEEHERAVSDVMYGIAYAIIDALDNGDYLKSIPYEG
jgi:hypothetical protein